MVIEQSRLNLAVGIGLLIGVEKVLVLINPPEGIRTFTIASMLGVVGAIFNFWLLLA